MKPLKRQLGSPALFGIVQGFIAASIYFSTGLVAERALGLTWAVFLAGGVLFAVIVPVYVEGASLHQERGGATVIARYGFNELRELHRRLGDLPGLPDPGRPVRVRDHGLPRDVLERVQLGPHGVPDRRGDRAVRGASWRSAAVARGASSGWPCSSSGTSFLQVLVVVLGLALLFEPDVLLHPASVAGSPSMENLVFAFPLVLVAFSGIDASSGLAGQVRIGRAGLRRLIGVRLLAALVPYLGIALIASSVLPQTGGPLGRGTAAGRGRRVHAGLDPRAAEGA